MGIETTRVENPPQPARAATRVELGAAQIATTIILYFIWFGTSLSETSEFLPIYRYAVNAALLAIAGAALTLFAFLRAKRGARLAGASLFLASVVLIIGIADVYILAFRFDTSGPNWNLVLTHNRWLNTFVRTNQAGFWERSLEPYQAPGRDDRYIIAAVGDSFTFGQGVLGAEYRFTNRLQRSLQDAFGPRVEVLNFGLGGGDTGLEAKWIREVVPQVHPDMVIVFYLANDINASAGGQATWDPPRTLLLASPTFNYAYWNLFGPFVYESAGGAYFRNLLEAYRDEQRMRQHLGEVDALINAIRDIGARPALVILPFPHMWTGVTKEVEAQIYRQIVDQAEASGAIVLNLAPLEAEVPPERFQVNRIDAHPNEAVHALIAGRVHEWLRKQPQLLEDVGRLRESN